MTTDCFGARTFGLDDTLKVSAFVLFPYAVLTLNLGLLPVRAYEHLQHQILSVARASYTESFSLNSFSVSEILYDRLFL